MIQLRGLVFADLPQILGIERDSFPSPWSAGMFILEMNRAGSVCLAAEGSGLLVGYVVCSKLDEDWHLMNIAVEPSGRRVGVGEQLMVELLSTLGPDARITLEVRPSNDAAIALYEKFGFLAAGRRTRYYADSGEDALIMWRTPATLRGSLDDVPNAQEQT